MINCTGSIPTDKPFILAETEEELKSLLMKIKESEKAGLKLNIQKTKIMAWQKEGGKVEAVTDFLFLGSKVTVDGDCRQETGLCLLLGRKVTTNLDSILKCRDTTLLTKFHQSSQSCGFSSSHVGM